MDFALLLIYLTIAIGFSFLCSIAEAVLLSITPSYLAERKRDPNKSAARIIRLKENVDRPLAAILSLNTIAHTVGAAGVGAQAAKVYGSQWVGVTSAVLTLLILVFSEIIPKTIGAMHWRKLAGVVAGFIDGLILLMLPLVWLSEAITKVLSSGGDRELVTRGEVAAIAELGTQEGVLGTRESSVLKNLLKLDSVSVEDVMTPRTVVIAREQSTMLSEFAEELRKLPVSRIPIYDKRLDNVVGFVLQNDIMLALLAGETDKTLADFSRKLIAVEEHDSIADTFEVLLNQREHIALVTDKYGGMEGIVTLEDVVETLLGLEIVDEQDAQVDMQKLARERRRDRAERQGTAKFAEVIPPTTEDGQSS
ncbi:Hemolysin C [Stieleria neptunia]|uniref:Hemolysin C n=1 Tax=Stieleria neptunia TaxID=2527979 RepID=A0A518HJA6_9BACT|nr:hemolysin family protein [Stieleria neptunia]QDV40936.1 Hemolysin C [Stieleria neptunia]